MSDVTPPLNATQLNERLAQAAAEMGIPIARARVMLVHADRLADAPRRRRSQGRYGTEVPSR